MAFQFNTNSFRRNTEIVIDHFPYKIEKKGSIALGLFLIVFASFWGGMPGYFFIKMIRDGEFEASKAFILIFPIIGTLLFLFGLSQFFLHEIWEITDIHIIYNKKGLFGIKKWMEPISKYRGVLSATEQRSSGGKNSSTYTVWVIYLYHDEYKKRIKLFESSSSSGVREKWENYARTFNRPAIERSGKEFITRDVDDLDKSVKELIREGEIKIDFDFAKPTPKGFEVKRAMNEVQVVRKSKPLGIFVGPPFVLAFCGVFIYLGFFGDAPILFGLVGTFFLIIFFVFFIYKIISTPCYAIKREEVHTYRLTPWGSTKGQRIKADMIESIDIKSSGNNYNALMISTDQREYSIGSGLRKDEREWLRDCMLYMISQS